MSTWSKCRITARPSRTVGFPVGRTPRWRSSRAAPTTRMGIRPLRRSLPGGQRVPRSSAPTWWGRDRGRRRTDASIHPSGNLSTASGAGCACTTPGPRALSVACPTPWHACTHDGEPTPRILVVLGGQEFLAERAISAAVVAWRRDGAEVAELSGTSDGLLGEVWNAASPDLFGSAPVVVVRDAESMDEATGLAVCDLAADGDAGWVLHHAGGKGPTKVRTRLSQLGTVVKADVLKGQGVERLRHRRVPQPPEDRGRRHRRTFARCSGHRPARFGQRGRATVQRHRESHIGREAAAQYYSGHVEIKGYEIADAVANRAPAAALESLRFALHEGGTRAGLMTVTALSTTLQRMAAAKSARPARPRRPRWRRPFAFQVDGPHGCAAGAALVVRRAG